MDLSGFAEILKIGGTQALMLIAFVWYLNERRKSDEKHTTELNSTLQQTLLKSQEREAENIKAMQDGFKELLQSIIDTQLVIAGSISRTEQKIDSNWSCPLVKEFHRGGK
jgi:hypothetical protein